MLSVLTPYDVAIVGAGPSGMMAALQAASAGALVVLLEKGDRVGRKLAICGGGRGNFTHVVPRAKLHLAYPDKAQQRFLMPAFSALDPAAVLSFFKSQGVPYIIEADDKAYPQSGRAQDLVDALEKRGLELGVKQITNAAVEKITRAADDNFQLFIKASDKCALEYVLAKSVILTTGGQTYPHTGSEGDGYLLASAFGHTITALQASLQSINLLEPRFTALSGLSLADVVISDSAGRAAVTSRGELLFTHFGLSGPAAVNFSRTLLKDQTYLRLDLMPERSAAQLAEDLALFCQKQAKRPAKSFLNDRLPHRLAEVLADLIWGAEAETKSAAHVGKTEREQLVQALKALALRLGPPRPFNQGMVTRGGVKLAEVNPKTMESRLCPRLYFAGELLDIDGPSGGYNLQAAFATGYVAGTAAARRSGQVNR